MLPPGYSVSVCSEVYPFGFLCEQFQFSSSQIVGRFSKCSVFQYGLAALQMTPLTVKLTSVGAVTSFHFNTGSVLKRPSLKYLRYTSASILWMGFTSYSYYSFFFFFFSFIFFLLLLRRYRRPANFGSPSTGWWRPRPSTMSRCCCWWPESSGTSGKSCHSTTSTWTSFSR